MTPYDTMQLAIATHHFVTAFNDATGLDIDAQDFVIVLDDADLVTEEDACALCDAIHDVEESR